MLFFSTSFPAMLWLYDTLRSNLHDSLLPTLNKFRLCWEPAGSVRTKSKNKKTLTPLNSVQEHPDLFLGGNPSWSGTLLYIAGWKARCSRGSAQAQHRMAAGWASTAGCLCVSVNQAACQYEPRHPLASLHGAVCCRILPHVCRYLCPYVSSGAATPKSVLFHPEMHDEVDLKSP